jgi:Mn2+/Fe2+ NRAMP family transporter
MGPGVVVLVADNDAGSFSRNNEASMANIDV